MKRTDPARALSALREAAAAFAEAQLDVIHLARAGLEQLVRVTDADAGAIAVPGQDETPEILSERMLGGAEPVSLTVLAEALAAQDGGTVVRDPPRSLSVVQAAITSVLCAPVRRKGRTLAAVYLDRRGASPAFDEAACDLAGSFAATLALALELAGRLETVQAQRDKAEEQAEEARSLVAHAHDFWHLGELRTRNDRFAQCLAAAERAARYHVDLLLQGETGTGKEHLARAVHNASGRKGRFVALNCTTLPESIAENELFGHEPGAFTGAGRRHRGCIEQADGGTLFLDEVGDLPAAIQPKLLRVLEDKRIRRVGGEDELSVDVRVIAATNKDLETEVRKGRFREDLYYRLRVVRLTVPPLRERLEDLPELARELLALCCAEIGRGDVRGWEPQALRRLAQHSWPGNVRELKNTIKELCVLIEGPLVTARDVETHVVWGHARAAIAPAEARPAAQGFEPGKPLRDQVLEAERQIIRAAIEQAGNVAAAARLLGLRKQTLYQRCLNLGIRGDEG
jgi:DNA-binding NtrC family response regulator